MTHAGERAEQLSRPCGPIQSLTCAIGSDGITAHAQIVDAFVFYTTPPMRGNAKAQVSAPFDFKVTKSSKESELLK